MLLALAAIAVVHVARLQAATPAVEATSDLRHFSIDEIRQRIKGINEAHSAALAAEDYDRAIQLLRKMDRFAEELERRSREAPVPRPPDPPPPQR